MRKRAVIVVATGVVAMSVGPKDMTAALKYYEHQWRSAKRMRTALKRL